MCWLSRFHWGTPRSKDMFCKWAFTEWDPPKHTSTSKAEFCSTHSYLTQMQAGQGTLSGWSWNTTVKTQRVELYNQTHLRPPSSAFSCLQLEKRCPIPIPKELVYALSCFPYDVLAPQHCLSHSGGWPKRSSVLWEGHQLLPPAPFFFPGSWLWGASKQANLEL